jgi:hypothetical protein
LSNDLLFLFFAMDHSWRILAPFGVSTKAGDDQTSPGFDVAVQLSAHGTTFIWPTLVEPAISRQRDSLEHMLEVARSLLLRTGRSPSSITVALIA